MRLEHAIKQIGAKRVMLDTIETLFGGLKDTGILRAELRRLFRWLRDRDITAVVTAERGEQMFTRQGLEEYITDAVISLDHRVHEQISTRRIRVVKYRGSTHGTNEYPFLIDRDGITVLPVTSLLLEHEAPNERVSTRPARARRHAGRQGLSTAPAPCCCPARRAPARPRWPRISSTPPARAARSACTSCSRNRRSR